LYIRVLYYNDEGNCFCFPGKYIQNGLIRGKIMQEKKFIPAIAIVCLCVLFNAATSCEKRPHTEKGSEKMEIIIESSAFQEGGMIPLKYTCDGINVSPPLKWSDPPEGTKSLALISDDPDAPMGIWVHWVVYNIPPALKEFPENIPSSKVVDSGAIQGTTDFGRIGYGGPCPPSGTHRYFFKLYALDDKLNLDPGATKQQVVDAMKGHVIAGGQLMGRYKRQ